MLDRISVAGRPSYLCLGDVLLGLEKEESIATSVHQQHQDDSFPIVLRANSVSLAHQKGNGGEDYTAKFYV